MINLPEISPYIFKIGSVGPTWYGLMYVVGFLLGFQLAKYRAKQLIGWTEENVSDLLTYTIFGVILGGRIGYVIFYNLNYFLNDPLYLFRITDGGMSFHGGLLGVIVALWLFAKSRKKSILDVGDFVAPLFPIGLFFGRIGNFINSELWGKTTEIPWGVVFPNGGPLPRHPSQLYEALLEGAFLFIAILFYSGKKPALGRLSGTFLLGYGIARFVVEFFRLPDQHIGYIDIGNIQTDWFTRGQQLSLPMIVIGLFFLLRRSKKTMHEKK